MRNTYLSPRESLAAFRTAAIRRFEEGQQKALASQVGQQEEEQKQILESRWAEMLGSVPLNVSELTKGSAPLTSDAQPTSSWAVPAAIGLVLLLLWKA